jgi:uncharacterized Fe-S cluster protein YjdI
MSKEIFKYSNKDITVTWKPKTCMHSTHCWRGLLKVFNPQKKPWINMEGAATDKIMEQVKKCPSGALSFHMNNDNDLNTDPEKIDE